jgi:tetratricopeptide (TPR) repeat protein
VAAEPSAGTAPAPDAARRFGNEAEALVSRGDLAGAIQRYQQAIAMADRPEYRLRLAWAAEKAGRGELIEPNLLAAVRINPDFAAAHHGLAVYYQRQGPLEAALDHSERAVSLVPSNSEFAVQRGRVLHAAGRPQAAWEAVEPLIAAGHADQWLLDLYARLAPSLGREWEALTVLERAMRAIDLPHTPAGRPLLHFGAAMLNDRLGRYDEAFEQARLGNLALRSSARRWDPSAHAQWVDRKVDYFTPARLGKLPRATHGDRRPVFIVGMPRSGTSLVEQILASHPAVAAAGELSDLGRVTQGSRSAEWARGASFPECLEHLSIRLANDMAGSYLSIIHRVGPSAAYVTDKMPINFLLLDWVELLLPEARVIHCSRNPLDTCLSCHMTHFAGGNEFKHDLAELGAFYRDYRRLMHHWSRVLPLAMLEVRYEDLVLDTETQVRRMLDFLALPWDERCLRYYENPRRVGTASEDQVRRRVYTSSIGRWKHYEAHLGELIAALGATV